MAFKPTRTSQVQFRSGGTANYSGLLKIGQSTEQLAKTLSALSTNRLVREGQAVEAAEKRQAAIDGSQIFTPDGQFISESTAKSAEDYAYGSAFDKYTQARFTAVVGNAEAQLSQLDELALTKDPYGEEKDGLDDWNKKTNELLSGVQGNELATTAIKTIIDKKTNAIQVKQQINRQNRTLQKELVEAQESIKVITDKAIASAYLAETPDELTTLLEQQFELVRTQTDIIMNSPLPNNKRGEQEAAALTTLITGMVGNYLAKQASDQAGKKSKENIENAAPPWLVFQDYIQDIRSGVLASEVNQDFLPYIDTNQLIATLEAEAKVFESIRSKKESDVSEAQSLNLGTKKNELAQAKTISEVDNIMRGLADLDLPYDGLSQLHSYANTQRSRITQVNEGQIKAEKEALSQKFTPLADQAINGVYPGGGNDTDAFTLLTSGYIANQEKFATHTALGAKILSAIKAIGERNETETTDLFNFYEEAYKSAPVGSAGRAKLLPVMEALADKDKKLGAKLIALQDSDADAQLRLKVKTDIERLNNNQGLQYYEDIEELKKAAMLLPNPDELAVSLLGAENKWWVTRLNINFNEAEHRFKTDHPTDKITTTRMIAGLVKTPAELFQMVEDFRNNNLENNKQISRAPEKFQATVNTMTNHAIAYEKEFERVSKIVREIKSESTAFTVHGKMSSERSLIEKELPSLTFDPESPDYLLAVQQRANSFGLVDSSLIDAANDALKAYVPGLRQDTDDDEGESGTEPLDKVVKIVSILDEVIRGMAASNPHLNTRAARTAVLSQISAKAQEDVGFGAISAKKAFEFMFYGVNPEQAIQAATNPDDMDSLQVKIKSHFPKYKGERFDLSTDHGMLQVFIDMSENALNDSIWADIGRAFGVSPDSEMFSQQREWWKDNKPPAGWVSEQVSADPMIRNLVTGTFYNVVSEYSINNANDFRGAIIDTWHQLRPHLGIEMRHSDYMGLAEKAQIYDPFKLIGFESPMNIAGLPAGVMYTATDAFGITDHNMYKPVLAINPIKEHFVSHGNFPSDGVLNPEIELNRDIHYIVKGMNTDFMYTYNVSKEDLLEGINQGHVIYKANPRLGDKEGQSYRVYVKTQTGVQVQIMDEYSPDFNAMKVAGVYNLAIKGVDFGKRNAADENVEENTYTEDQAKIIMPIYRDTALIGRYALRKAIERELKLQDTVGVADILNQVLNSQLEAARNNRIIGLDASSTIMQEKYNITDEQVREFAGFFQSVFNIPESRLREAGYIQ